MSYDTSVYPYDTVVQITDVIGGQSWQGSGVLIAPDEVLTASHVVYIQGEGTASDIVVTPGYNDGSSPYGSADGTYIHYFPVDDANRMISGDQSQSDYAVIHLSTSFPSAGTMGIQSDFAGGSVDITGYPASAGGYQVDSSQTVTLDPNYTLLDGTALGEGSSGGPVWTDVNGSPSVVGVVSSESDTSSTGYNTLITTTAFDQIQDWLAADGATNGGAAPASGSFSVTDTTTGVTTQQTGQPYAGPVTYLSSEYIQVTSDNLNIGSFSPNAYIVTGSGNDGVDVSKGGGENVISAGTGNNFLTGGSGDDTFFLDDRTAGQTIWDTINNFHAGDAVTIWGMTPQQIFSWANNQGAPGYTGLTFHTPEPGGGGTMASLTFAGFSQTDLTDGKLSSVYGTDPSTASPYLYIQEH